MKIVRDTPRWPEERRFESLGLGKLFRVYERDASTWQCVYMVTTQGAVNLETGLHWEPKPDTPCVLLDATLTIHGDAK